jgi:transposase
VSIRIQLSRATVKDLHSRLQHAYRRDDVRLVRRITGVIDLLVHHVPVEVLPERWGLSISCIYQWRQDFLLRGLDSLVYHQSGGRRPKLPPQQKQRWVELIEAGPLVVGGETACWHSVLIRVLIWREFGVLYNCQYVWYVAAPLGLFVSKGPLCVGSSRRSEAPGLACGKMAGDVTGSQASRRSAPVCGGSQFGAVGLPEFHVGALRPAA